MRKCNQCEFEVEGSQQEELAGMSDHLTVHNPSPAKWTEAYNQIRAGRERRKREENV